MAGRSTGSLVIMKSERGQIDVEEALRRGFWTVKAPSMTVLLAPIAAFVTLAKLGYIPSTGYAGMKWAVPTFLISFLGSWFVWAIQVPRWRVWAYRRVNDVALLKQRAVESQLMWPDSSIFTRTELMSPATRHELEKLDKRHDD